MTAARWILAAVGCLAGGFAFAAAVFLRGSRIERVRRRKAAFGAEVADGWKGRVAGRYRGLALRYAEMLNRRLFAGTTQPLSPVVRAKRADRTRAGKRYLEQAVAAGCSKDIGVSAYCEARFRMAAIGCVAGFAFGSLFTPELSAVLGLAGLAFFGTLLSREVKRLKRERGMCAERHLSEMLEVVALGLRSGLTFDRSFALYGSHFENEFAHSCAKACRSWSLGLMTRDDALHDLASSYDCAQLRRVVDSVIRSLKFGSSCTELLEEAAAQSRLTYRSALEERVAKAPVKMMLPTGTLILPAMLLLVMGPVLLELAGGF